MAYWKMTMNGDSAFRKQLIWPVVINSAISLSPFCVIVHLLTHRLCGWNSVSTFVMTSDMLCTRKTSCLIPPMNTCLTMASTSLMVYCALETKHFRTGQVCLFHNTTGLKLQETDSLLNSMLITMSSKLKWPNNAFRLSMLVNVQLLMPLLTQLKPSQVKPSFFMVLEELAKHMSTTLSAIFFMVKAKLSSVWHLQALHLSY